MRSWRKRVFFWAGVVLAFMIIMVLWTNLNSYVYVADSQSNSNSQAAALWSNILANRLDSLESNRRDVAIVLYNSSEFFFKNGEMSLQTKASLKEAMTDKMLVNTDISFLYVYDTVMKKNLLVGHSQTTGKDQMEVISFFNDNDVEEVMQADGDWTLLNTGNNNYFSCATMLGKYIVGILSNANYYKVLESVYLIGGSPACYFVQGNEILCLAGGEGSNYFQGDEELSKLFNRTGVLISSEDIPALNAQIVMVAEKESIMKTMSFSLLILTVCSAVCVIAFLVLVRLVSSLVVKPTEIIIKANNEIRHGNIGYRIKEKANSEEYELLFESFNSMVQQINNLRIENYESRLAQRNNELILLRAQLRPHYYLNALTTAHNLTYTSTPEDVRHYLQLLTQHMRYMLSIHRDMVPLELELNNIRNYINMQNTKQPGSIEYNIDCAEELRKVEIPFLLVFTIVENAFKHAMTLYKPLQITINCKRIEISTFSGLSIIIEDNGQGFPEEVLNEYQADQAVPMPKDHIGLSNVKRTLQLLYGRRDLLRISNVPDSGAHVEMRVPDEFTGDGNENPLSTERNEDGNETSYM